MGIVARESESSKRVASAERANACVKEQPSNVETLQEERGQHQEPGWRTGDGKKAEGKESSYVGAAEGCILSPQ
jgi:hypothetical protein